MDIRRGSAVAAVLMVALTACGSAEPDSTAEALEAGQQSASAVLPAKVESNGELISVSASGALVIRSGRTICVYSASGIEEFCRDFEDTNLRLGGGVYTPEWNASGDEVGFEVEGGTVMLVKLHSETIESFGGRDELTKAAVPY